jgi:hypothetical protein
MTPEVEQEIADTGLSLCPPSEFLERVDRIIDPGEASSTPRPISLLAHFQLETAQTGESQRGFVNLLAMDPSKVLIESGEPLQQRDSMNLNFLLPRTASPDESAERISISLRCEITGCENLQKLHYWGKVLKVEEKSKAPLEQFIRTLCGPEGSP